MKKYYIDVNGETKGPFTLDQLRSMWSSGKLKGHYRYCIEGGNTWTKLEMLQSVLEEKNAQESSDSQEGTGLNRNQKSVLTLAIIVLIALLVGGASIISIQAIVVWIALGFWFYAVRDRKKKSD